MKASEILWEGERSTVESDLEDFLIASKANELEEIETEDLVDQLNSMGHSVTADSILDMIEELELDIVKNATINTITIKSHTGGEDGETNDGDDEYSEETPEERAENFAQKAAMKRVKQRAKQKRKATKGAQL